MLSNILVINKDDFDVLNIYGKFIFYFRKVQGEPFKVMSIFASVLQGSELRSLNLCDNVLGEKGLRVFGSFLNSQNILEELYFMNNNMIF